MTFRRLFFVSAAIMLASSAVADRVPPNATPTHSGKWACDSGYRRTGNRCVSRSGCNRKPSTCLRTFIRKKDYASASSLYNENQELFQTAREKKRRSKQLRELVDYLNSSFAPRIDVLQNSVASIHFDPLAPSGWSAVTSTLFEAREFRSNYLGHKILSQDEYDFPAASEFLQLLSAKQEQIDVQRQNAFLAYDHAREDSFFNVFPLVISDDVASLHYS